MIEATSLPFDGRDVVFPFLLTVKTPFCINFVDVMKFWRKPLDAEKVKVSHGEIHILQDRCKGCAFCVEYCPRDVLEMSSEFTQKGYHPPFVRNPESCVSCGLCEMLCPDFAIFCVTEDEEAKVEG
jgi:2-oxoglutarate ferredoxin oxidoreductase subunit delta